jgi:CO/xanthine dehydrogenase Mo-binding subunit
MPEENVTVHAAMSGGAFGRKALSDVGLEAARLAKGIGQPVRVNWTREEEFQLDQFRPAMLIELKTGLDASGNIPAWQYDLYAAAYYAPLGPNPMSASANAGADASGIYGLDNIQTTFYQSQSPLPVHNWRANGTPVNALARETALDELAEMAGTDPVTFRERLLANNPRMLAVMHAAVQKAGWTPGVGRSGQGIGMALDFSDGTYVAEVAHVSVDPGTGTPRVSHIDVAVDCGLVVNPAGARAQVEGGVIGQGVSSTLYEGIGFANGRVTNPAFRQYGMLRMNDAPTVDVVFVEDKSQPMQGLGEPAVGAVSAAISNAIYDAIGVRMRELPITSDRIQTARQASGSG